MRIATANGDPMPVTELEDLYPNLATGVEEVAQLGAAAVMDIMIWTDLDDGSAQEELIGSDLIDLSPTDQLGNPS